MRAGTNKAFVCMFLAIYWFNIVPPLYSSSLHVEWASTDPPVLGDWIIDTAVVKTGEIINLNGSLVIQDNGSLTLSAVELIFALQTNGVSNGSFNITVLSGGTLILNSGTMIRTDNPSLHSWINISPRSRVDLINSTFENLGYDVSHPAILVDNAAFQIVNSTILHKSPSSPVIRLFNTTDALIQDNKFTSTHGLGITSVYGTNLTIKRNALVTKEDALNVDNFRKGSLLIKENELLSETGMGINISGQSNPNEAVNLEISDNIILGAHQTGIYLRALQNVSIHDNQVSNVKRAVKSAGSIHIIQSSNVNVTKNSLVNSGDDAIIVEKGENAIISLNTISWVNISSITGTGINITDSNTISILSNKISLIGGDGINVGPIGTNITIQFNAISRTIGRGISLIGLSGSLIANNHLNDIKDIGIYLLHSSDCNVSRNDIVNVQSDAISSINSTDFKVIDNYARSIQGAGLSLIKGKGAIVRENLFLENLLGISLENINSSKIQENYIRDMYQYGFFCNNLSRDNDVNRNVLFRNQFAIYCEGNSTSFYNNSIIGNINGVWMSNESRTLTIYLNDFIGNLYQAADWGISNNWYENVSALVGYQGNYWSDYKGEDTNEPIGLGDIPYNITGNSADLYPLINQIRYFSRPSISHPSDLTYTDNIKGNFIKWVASSELKPLRYEILVDDIEIIAGLWDGSPIFFSLDTFSIGSHVIMCTVYDFLEQKTSDAVVVNIKESQKTSSSTIPSTTSGVPESPLVILGRELLFIGASLIIAILLTIFIAKTKRQN